MTTKTKVREQELKLSCREARLVLPLIPLEKDVDYMSKEELAAIKHYVDCKSCRDIGLAEILEVDFSCREAILVWAGHLGLLPQRSRSLIEELSVEHVWGLYDWKNSMGGHGYDNSTACNEQPCRKLQHYWLSVPMSSSAGDGEEGVINEFPFLIKLFVEEEWSFDELFKIQRERVTNLLNDIKNGEVTVSIGHYHLIEDLMSEVSHHIRGLQLLAP
jgi:hypothetical protein